MQNTAQPNDTARELEQLRKDKIAEIVKKKESKDDNVEKKSEENSENNEKKLDIDQKNSYIKDKEKNTDEPVDDKSTKKNDKSSQEDALKEYEKLLNEQFDGDGRKAIKSWKEANRNYHRLRDESQKMKEQINAIESLVNKNPLVKDILKIANEKGQVTQDDLQSFIGKNDRESDEGKPNKSNTESKLEVVDVFDTKVSEKELSKLGYLDLDNKDLTPTEEWNLKVQRAKLNYIASEMPERLAKEAAEKTEKQIAAREEERKRKAQEKENAELNARRYREGLDHIIDEFNLDFAGNEQHEALLDDIEELAVNIRDRQNPNVLHKDAMVLATIQVLREKNIQVDKPTDVDDELEKANKTFDETTGFNKATRTPEQTRPNTIAEKLRQRLQDRYDKEQSWRRDNVIHVQNKST